MSFAWTDNQTLKLVILYSRHECMWNPFHPEFKNKFSRYKAYKDIAKSMFNSCLTVCDCIQKITQIKSQYCYELSKITAAISCEKIYIPTVNWFPIIHELLFPFVKTYGYKNYGWKVCNKETSLLPDYHSSEVTNQLRNSNIVEIKGTQRHCNCPYTNCGCNELYRTQPRTSCRYLQSLNGSHIIPYLIHTYFHRKYWTGGNNDKGTNYLHSQVARINTGCSTRKCITTENEMQTDLSAFKTTCSACQTCTIDVAKNISEDADAVHEGKKIFCDEFDMFGKSIACQLRNINFEAAIKLEKRIQALIAQERLSTMKYISHSFNAACCNSSCSECRIVRNETVCSCGLPLIKIQADASCEFCK
ncbi:uncharacterized protein LOC143354039 [Halictus rubicundus]|uniref:uncharacterized protein LOC143354039 n=1 Tax=Halictus rubicundus TaxID=77578 RepID=UPI004034F973